jgi:hypothetical protein
MKNLNYDIFQLAAEYQFEAMTEGTYSEYSCDNIMDASFEFGYNYNTKVYREVDEIYQNLYQKDSTKYYKEGESTLLWWPKVNGEWDHESRILALLLAAEILKD